jgi:hypothetical protein
MLLSGTPLELPSSFSVPASCVSAAERRISVVIRTTESSMTALCSLSSKPANISQYDDVHWRTDLGIALSSQVALGETGCGEFGRASRRSFRSTAVRAGSISDQMRPKSRRLLNQSTHSSIASSTSSRPAKPAPDEASVAIASLLFAMNVPRVPLAAVWNADQRGAGAWLR